MPDMRRHVVWLARCGLYIVTLLAIASGADAAWRNQPGGLLHTVEHQPNDAIAPPDCGILLSSSAATQSDRSSVRVVVAVDDAWLGDDRSEALNGALVLFRDLTAAFDGLGIHLRVVRLETWSSSNDYLSVSDRLEEVKADVALADDDIVVALTGQRPSRADGKASIGGRYALVFRHPGRPERDLWVAAHEIGHLFGARHTEKSKAGSNIMSPNGFGSEIRWSPCHRRLLRMNADRFEQRPGLVKEDLWGAKIASVSKTPGLKIRDSGKRPLWPACIDREATWRARWDSNPRLPD